MSLLPLCGKKQVQQEQSKHQTQRKAEHGNENGAKCSNVGNYAGIELRIRPTEGFWVFSDNPSYKLRATVRVQRQEKTQTEKTKCAKEYEDCFTGIAVEANHARILPTAAPRPATTAK
jgi:hypothetical protein